MVPYTSVLPAGANAEMVRRSLLSTLVMKVRGSELSSVEAQLRDALAREYGDDTKLHVWEGTLEGESGMIEQARKTVFTLPLVVNLLGFVLLVTASIGILSIMLVEILGRAKEISLERALGASRMHIIREYFARSILLSLASVVVGIVLSVIFSRPLADLLLPVMETLSVSGIEGGVLSPLSVVIGAAVTLAIGGIFGVFPVFSTLATGISEGMREV